MGKKYLLEIEENKDGSFAWSNFAPYTEPDLEQVRKEAYEKGRKDVETQFCSYDACKNRQKEYQRGLADAWEAARKICLNDSDGGLTVTEIANIFDVSYYRDAMKKYSAQEAIEEIRAYEQAQKEKEEQIKIGDEVIIRNKTAVVTEITDRYVRIMYSDGNSYALFSKGMVKTGRHFPEIAEVLAKMKETNNG